MILEAVGKELGSGDGYQLLGYQSSPTQSITYGIKNTSANSIEATIDLTECEDDTQFNSRGQIIKKVVKAGETEFMVHVIPGPSHNPKNIKHSAKDLGPKK